MKKKLVWFDARNLKNEEVLLPLVYNLHFEYLLVNNDMIDRLQAPHKIKLIVDIDNTEEMETEYQKDVILFSKSIQKLKKAKNQGYITAIYKFIENQDDMEAAWKDSNDFDYLVVDFKHETNIPLELLIARLQNSQVNILKHVKTQQEAEISLGVMQIGSDGIVLRSEDINEVVRMDKYMANEEIGKLDLVTGTVVNVEHIGMGYRACIDTTNLMKQNEGMIIGSTSNGGLIVSSETHYLPYMELRPFRVNAGAVHSYIWAGNEMTNYLTELKAGSKIICIDTEGNTREVSVGRVKTEMRPLLKIEVEVNGTFINSIVQDDWHIRIFGATGEPLNASTIKKGDQLLTYMCNGGRHVGIKIDEALEEK